MPDSRSGVTLLELVVTLTLVSLGLLAVARPLATLQRAATATRLTLHTVAAVAVEAEHARVAPCRPGTGSGDDGPVRLRWTRTTTPGAAATVVEGETVAGLRTTEAVRACR